MDLHFLGGATTVTGSQFLLESAETRILVDCGMFQGGPTEAIRNRVPFAFDPATIDALLVTHAHLDHCGLIPHLVAEGFRGPIHATAGTIELATLVLLDSAKLQAEFAKRDARREQRDPERAAAEDAEDLERFEAALEEAEAGEAATDPGTAGATAEPSRGQAARGGAAAEGGAAAAEGGAAAAEGGALGQDAPRVSVDADPGRPDHESDLRAQPAELDVDLDEPLYSEDDVRRALALFRPVDYGDEREIVPGVHATFHDAGHILGSAIIQLRVADSSDGPERTIVFSGDLGRPNSPIIRDPTVLTDADYVVCESTYGGREHDPQAEAIRVLAETVRLVAENDGVLLVPAFAIGRTQEIVWTLDRLIETGAIPLLPLYLDSPMASKASDIYRRHAEYFDEPTRKLLGLGATPLDYPRQTVTNAVAQSKAISRARRPYMIVASNGMLTGGRVIAHFRELVDDPAAVVLFVGYQGEGTLGAHLQRGARTVRIDGQDRVVRCQVRSISGFSAHADEPELLGWLGRFIEGRRPGDPGVPRRVFLVHGDPEAQQALEPKVRALGLEPIVPRWRQGITLD
jgi:metallo-beta-lactamase family protein